MSGEEEFVEVNAIRSDENLMLQCSRCGPMMIVEPNENRSVEEQAEKEMRSHMVNEHNVPDEHINRREGA